MKFLIPSILIIMSVYFLSCDSKNENEGGSDNLLFPDLEIAIPVDSGKVILFNGANPTFFIMDFCKVNYAEFDTNILNIEVSFPGGCKEHQFYLIAWDYFLESYPVRANLLLSHNANSDSCEAWVTSKLSFDMTPLKQEYFKLYRGTSGSIILRIFFCTDKQFNLEYKFNI